MSSEVAERMRELGVVIENHMDRIELDRQIEEYTHTDCDKGVYLLSDDEFMEIVNRIKKKKKILVCA